MVLIAAQIFITIFGLFCAVRVWLVRRFGPASWLLSFFLVFCTITAGIGFFTADPVAQPLEWIFRADISAMLMAAPLGLLFAWSVDRSDYRQVLAGKRKLVTAVIAPIPLLLASLWLFHPSMNGISISEDYVALGPSGYLASLYLIIISVVAVSTLEQAVRSVEERYRWEIKFLVLGMAGSYAAIIYVASKALIYSHRYALVPRDSFYVFACIFPVSCVLILVSWRRSSGNARIPVSQTLIYSSITLLSVGAYLIVSAILARWVGSWSEFGLQTQAFVFLLSIIALASILLWTSFRHRVRNWIRRYIFAGKYDYRQFWMEATEKVRSVDGPESSALALANIIQSALGAIDVSVWLRRPDPDRLLMAGALGCYADSQEKEVKGVLESFVQVADPVTVDEVGKVSDKPEVQQFIKQARAVLLVPLCSSGRIVGLLTIGSDRSGRAYNWEAREFLRVLANHAASEFHKYELLSSLVAAKEAEAFKSFSIFLLHDLKNFASTLSLVAKNAGRHQANPDFQRDAFQSVFETAEKMKRLCNNLRLFSASLASNRKQDDLNKIVKSAAGVLNTGLLDRIHFELSDLPPVYVDSEEVARVLQNLLMNAQQAISPAGSITIKTARNDGMAELIVTDDGIGMTREFLEKELFLPFHTTKSDGLGIGLFQCKKIIEAHGGEIYIQSEEGKGTAVRVRLPLNGEK